MNPYCLKIKIKPEIENNHHASLAAAYAAVFVLCDTEEEAKTKAITYLSQNQWEVQDIQTVYQMTSEQILHLDETLAKGYREAKTSGISSVILDAWPHFLDQLYYSNQSLSTLPKKDL